MSYNIPKMLNSEFQSPSIKIQYSKLILLVFLTLSAPKGGGVKMLNIILRMSYNLPKALTLEFQSPNIKIEDFKINTFNFFNPISTKGGSELF